MIDPKELRIGNWVKYISKKPDNLNENAFVQVVSIDQDSIDFVNGFLLSKNLFGVPLTPEILVSCGFEEFLKGVWEFSDSGLEIESRDDGFILSININEYTVGEPFKYVHQLQNLTFAITGTELSFTPNNKGI